MAQNADSVVVEVEAKLEGFNTKMKAGEQQFDQTMNRVKSSAGKAEAAVSNSMNKISSGFDRAGQRSRLLGYQIADIGTQLTSGTNPFLIMSQQAPQVANALDGTTGAMGRLATFLSGPLGAAILAGASILGVLAMRAFEATDKTEKQKDATKSLADAISELEATTRNAIQTQSAALRNQELQTKATLEAAIAVREKTKTLIEEAIATEELNKARVRVSANDPRIAASLQDENRQIEDRIALLRLQLPQQEIQIDQAKRALSNAQAASSLRRAEAATDGVTKATVDYEDALEKLNGQRTAGLLGPVGSEAAAKKYEAEAIALMKVRDAAIEAARALERKPRGGTGTGQITDFIMPVSGPITSGFGARTPPTKGASSYHPAIDIAAPAGTPVKAAAGGIVVTSGRMGGLGNVVIVDHGGGTISEYGHLSELIAQRGQRVEQGQVIGKVGSTGISTGAHLDYRVKTGGRYVDPRTGKFSTDELAAGQAGMKAEESAAAKETRQTNAFNAEMADINQSIIAARRPIVTSYEQDLELAEEAIKIETDRQNQAYLAAASEDKITAAQAELLIAKNNELASAKVNAAKERETERAKRAQGEVQIAREQIEVDVKQAELDQAKTAGERKDVALRLLDAELELERLKLQQIIDTSKVGSAEAEIAKLRIADLDRLRGVRTDQINRDPANQNPLQKMSADLDKTSDEMIEDLQRVAVEGLGSLEDGIVDAIMHAKSLGDVFSNVADQIIQALIRIAVQQAIIKPLASLLGGGSGAGGILGAIGGIFGGGAGGSFDTSLGSLAIPDMFRASGGPVRGHRPYIVGENGPELFVPGGSGNIVPNNTLANGGGASTIVQTFVLDARGGIVTQDLLRQVNALATSRAAQAGKAAYDAGQKAMPGRLATYGKLGT